MRDGLVTDPDRLAAELKRLFAEHKFSKRVRVGLATPRTVLRVIDLPPLDDKDIRTALKMQAQERIPMPLDRAVMDFQKVGLVDTPEGQRLRVIVVATEREGVDQLLETLRRAGLKPEGIDLSVFSVIRALSHLQQRRVPCCTRSWATSSTSRSPSPGCAGSPARRRRAWRWSSADWRRTAASRSNRLMSFSAQQRRGPARRGRGARGRPAQAHCGGARLRAARRGRVLLHAVRQRDRHHRRRLRPSRPASRVRRGAVGRLGARATCGEVIADSPDALGDVDARIAPVATGLAVGVLHS